MIGVIDVFQGSFTDYLSLRPYLTSRVRSRMEELDDDSYYSLAVL